MTVTTITEKEIKLLSLRLNRGVEQQIPEQTRLTQAQFKKGLAWLQAQAWTPKGEQRKNSPFGAREEEALETAEYMTFDGFYDAGTAYNKFMVPIYSVVGGELEDGYVPEFQYYVSGGKINIIG